MCNKILLASFTTQLIVRRYTEFCDKYIIWVTAITTQNYVFVG